MEKSEKIRPSEMQFYYLHPLTDYDCYELHTGKCSLEEPFVDSVVVPSGHPYYRQREACQSLYISVKKGSVAPVEIVKHGCGHYSFIDGQHRVCVARKKDLSIIADVSDGGPDCCFCAKLKTRK